MNEINKEELHIIAMKIRQFLKEEFPDFPNMKNQCKRASILFDLYCKNHKIQSYPTAGFITKSGDQNDYERGHVWNVVKINNQNYFLDITLSQFEEYLGKNVPEVMVMPAEDAKEIYGYHSDGYGEYEYEFGDVRLNLVEKVNLL